MGKLLSIARKSKSRAPMEELSAVSVTQETGVEGDVRGTLKKRQVTVISADVWQEVCDLLESEIAWTTRRANFLVEGVELPKIIGTKISIGGAVLEVTEETAPCTRMDEQHEGLRAALSPDWRGGVCCRVLSGAVVAVGDKVEVLEG